MHGSIPCNPPRPVNSGLFFEKVIELATKKTTPKSEKVEELHNDALMLLEEMRKSGDKTSQVLGSDEMMLKIRGVVSSQIPTVDLAIGRGGYPLGRLTILTGGEGGGKTTLALHAVAECQRQRGLAIYVDREFKLDPDYAQKIGVDKDALIIARPRTCEEFCEKLHGWVTSVQKIREKVGKRRPVVIVLDSLNALKAKAVVEGDAGDKHIATEARIWSQELPEIMEIVSKEDIALMFISQVRKKIGVMFGSPDEIAGGEAPKFFASAILKVTYVGAERKAVGKVAGKDEKQKTVRAANKLEIEIIKNQIAAPFRKAHVLMTYGKGADKERALLQACEELEIIKLSGKEYSDVTTGEVYGSGLNATANAIRENKAWRMDLKKRFREAAGWDAL